MPLTPDAKKLLAETIRGTAQDPDKGIRARLLSAIHDEADRRYRLSVPIERAELDEENRRRRERIEAWIDERARATKPKSKAELNATKDRLLAEAEKEAAATLVNRLVLLRHLEALGLSKPQVLTGGWSSKGYREFREFAPTLCTNGTTDGTEGYATLLQFLFDELAVDLPGLFGDVGLTRLFPIPASTLRDVVERLDAVDLSSAWSDDTTLGWVYQFWNDFERDALDAKALDRAKIEPYEIAPKTQMFTDRYIVEWLLQNSLGLTWLAMCTKHQWTPDAARVLPLLDERRAEWRKKREVGEVALDALMPLSSELEEHWKYYVPQHIPDDAIEKSPDSVRDIKILDPACGSGHFLIIAFDMLAALYREEARHRGTTVSDREIAESILENNIHGIDIDPRAIQIAAAGLFLKARRLSKSARPKTVNLVAPVLQLGNLPPEDPAILTLRRDLKSDVGIPEELTAKLLSALAGVDHLGSLLQVDAAVEDAIRTVELDLERKHGQGDLFGGFPTHQVRLSEVKATVLGKLEDFLSTHSKSEELGLRLDGEQLAAGVRFVRIAKEKSFDLVVGNPPYLGLVKTSLSAYVTRAYPLGKADLCTAFMERVLGLLRVGGFSALVVMRSWMFLGQFAALRRHFSQDLDIRLIGDLDKGAFESMPTSQLISVAMLIVRNAPPTSAPAVALQPTAPGEKFWGPDRTDLKRAAILAQRRRFDFDPRGFEVIDGEPLVYWWPPSFLAEYAHLPKVGESSPGRAGLISGDNVRFVRFWWETSEQAYVRWSPDVDATGVRRESALNRWVPFILGGKGRKWFEPLKETLQWRPAGLEVMVKAEHDYGSVTRQIRNAHLYFQRGVAFTMVGNAFSARAHRYASVMDGKGSSCFAQDWKSLVALMNSAKARYVLESLNTSVNFQIGDVNRLPRYPIVDSESIVAVLEREFERNERAREASFEFCSVGPTAWMSAQAWAQRCVDRADGEALPVFECEWEEPEPQALVSFAIGTALGRFGRHGEGLLKGVPEYSLPSGILFVAVDAGDSLDLPAAQPIVDAWREHGASLGDDLRNYLRKSFFELHKRLYDNRPIYFPLSSSRRNFVAFVSIHRWTEGTLTVLLADHLVPARRRLEGELDDLRIAKASSANRGKAEKRFAEVQKLLEDLNDFITRVTEVGEKGPPPPDEKTTKREVDARYVMDLDDGVMVNSSALWPLLEPEWKEPKKWWKELANAQGKKDYDWSHLAARYFPSRVRKKCHEDPSLAVAHKCFWELHPTKAYAWELRLQDEIRPDFTIDEPGSDEARAKFLRDHDRESREILAKEMKRREKKSAKQDEGDAGPLFEASDDEGMEDTDA